MRTLWACYNDTDDEAYESYYDRRYEAQRSPSSLYGGLPETKIDLINASVDSIVLCLNLFASRFEAVCNAPNDVLYPLYSPIHAGLRLTAALVYLLNESHRPVLI